MIYFILTFAIVVMAITAMAIGVIMGRAPIRGSCGGLGNSGGCELCTGKCRRKEHGKHSTR